MVCAFSSSFIFATLVTMSVKLIYSSLPVRICSPFIDPTGEIFLIKFMTWLIVLIQLIVAMVVIIVHVLLIKELKKSQQQIGGTTPKKLSTWKTTMQIVLIIISNVICWVPSGIIFLKSTFIG